MKGTIISSIVAGLLIVGALYYSRANPPGVTDNANNVKIENGTQIVEIRAKGGYTPRKSVAKAGLPTIIRFETSGTFDCSAFVSIPSLNVSQALALSGNTDINAGTPAVGTLQGTCGMGMYPFEIDFEG
ncbi:MAG TPA: cupredoxin domain-containing protein [Candidatus Paceibacterota bacterium]